jgi:hypothetical protein
MAHITLNYKLQLHYRPYKLNLQFNYTFYFNLLRQKIKITFYLGDSA